MRVIFFTKFIHTKMQKHNAVLQNLGFSICPQCVAIVKKSNKRCMNRSSCRKIRNGQMPLCDSHLKQWKRGLLLKNTKECDLLVPKELTRKEMFIMAHIQILDKIVNAVSERILTTEKLMEKFCLSDIRSNQKVKDFLLGENILAKKVQECAKEYEETQTINPLLVEDIQTFYTRDFEALESQVHEELQKQCKDFPAKIRPQLKSETTTRYSCEQADIPEFIMKWYFQSEPEWKDKQIMCSLEKELVFEVGDVLPKNFIVLLKENKFLGIARKTEQNKTIGPLTWPETIKNYTFSSINILIQSMSWIISTSVRLVGMTSSILAMMYKNISYKAILVGMAASVGLLTVPYVTDMGMESVMIMIKYSSLFCKLATNKFAMFALAALVARGLQSDQDSLCEFTGNFGKVSKFFVGYLETLCFIFAQVTTYLYPSSTLSFTESNLPEYEQVGKKFSTLLSSPTNNTDLTIQVPINATVSQTSIQTLESQISESWKRGFFNATFSKSEAPLSEILVPSNFSGIDRPISPISYVPNYPVCPLYSNVSSSCPLNNMESINQSLAGLVESTDASTGLMVFVSGMFLSAVHFVSSSTAGVAQTFVQAPEMVTTATQTLANLAATLGPRAAFLLANQRIQALVAQGLV